MSKCDKPSGPKRSEWEKLTLTKESVGNYYWNRNGENVKVSEYTPDDDELYPFVIRVVPEAGKPNYRVSYYGEWYRGTRNGKDLMEQDWES
jgi:hypothetical protein